MEGVISVYCTATLSKLLAKVFPVPFVQSSKVLLELEGENELV
jgi:hypothetical protein